VPTIRVNDIDLYYETAGEGPPVLLIHGLGSSTRDWEYQVGELARGYRVIAFDVRGHGRSDKPPGPYSVAQFAGDAVALLRALEAAPAHVVGLSMGGMIAFQMAVDAPQAVRSLTIVNSGPAMILRTFAQRAMIRVRFAVVRVWGMRALGRMIAQPLFPRPEQEKLRRRFMDSIAANDPRAYLDSLRALIGWSVEERIGGISCPVLIVSSDQDYTPVDWKRQYAARIPGARVVVVKNSRHVTPMDQPAELNRLVGEFLETSGDFFQAVEEH
jgi:3-oxoadipate enol-lactonase